MDPKVPAAWSGANIVVVKVQRGWSILILNPQNDDEEMQVSQEVGDVVTAIIAANQPEKWAAAQILMKRNDGKWELDVGFDEV